MKHLEEVKKILSSFFSLKENPTFIFGSRANNTHRENSDLDLFIDDCNISAATMALLDEAFEESDIPYKIEIVLRSRIDDDFYETIRQKLIPLK